MKRIERYLITGLAVVGPVFLSVYLLIVVFQFIDGILGRLVNSLLKNHLGFTIPGLGFVLFFLVLIFVGFLANRFLGRRMGQQIEKWFSGLPLINLVYPTIKQIILFISAQKEFGFKRVVLVEYPSKGIWSLGFITNEQFYKINTALSRDMIAVFIPSTPGPLSGFFIFVPREELKFPDISVGEALKIIISGGVFKP
ncbi:MAG: DUF502 domain-containing protein [Candidatus Omnitrophica bacterium]|nr:DUF502 domain-containing protein [Candidatus Omnitrophota bacterium]